MEFRNQLRMFDVCFFVHRQEYVRSLVGVGSIGQVTSERRHFVRDHLFGGVGAFVVRLQFIKAGLVGIFRPHF